MKKQRANLIPLSVMNKYVKAVECKPVVTGESPLEIIAESISRRHGIERGQCKARTFVEQHRDIVFAGARGAQEVPRKPRSSAIHPVSATTQNVASDSFLSSYEWRRLRMQALKKYGAQCQCCGATPATGAVMNVDHIRPRRLFPDLALTLSNLQVLCHECNHGKGNWDMTDWRGVETVP